MHISGTLCVLLVAASVLLGCWPDTLIAQGAYTDRNIALYQRMIRRQPGDAAAYYRLGDAYIQKARETGDGRYYALAEQALRQALEFAPHYGSALRHLAHALHARHAFAEAAGHAARAIAVNPADSHAYGVLGDAYLELGQYPQAQEAYHAMLQLRQDLYAYTRLAGLKSLLGDPHGAIADLKHAMQPELSQGLPRESIAWVQWQLGNEYYALGDLVAAAAWYQQVLETFPHYHRALASLANVRAAQQRYAEAIDLYRRALGIIPMPEYAAALGDVYSKINRPEDAAKQYALVEYMGYLNGVNAALYNRELAVFYADHDKNLPQALALARQEIAVRQDIYAYDLLAWALYKNAQPAAARTAINEALKLGTQDARLFFHAGMIAHRLDDRPTARMYLERALTLNPHFHLFHADVAARTLQELGPSLAQTLPQVQPDDQ